MSNRFCQADYRDDGDIPLRSVQWVADVLTEAPVLAE
jgi:hypothetical protein